MTEYSEEYRALLTDAIDAVGALLLVSTPDSWLRLRGEYGYMKDALGRDERASKPDAATLSDTVAPHRAWRMLPVVEREHRILNALGEEQLSVAQLAERLMGELGDASDGRLTTVETSVRLAVTGLCEGGEVQRLKEPRAAGSDVRCRGAWRWKYSRRRSVLSPELRDLQRRLDEMP